MTGVTGTDTPRPRRPAAPAAPSPARGGRRTVRAARCRVAAQRDDLIHPELVGNKWRKLAPTLATAGGRALVTFGGAYSNHLRAAAAAGRLLGLPTVGVVRGHELVRPAAQPLAGPVRRRRDAAALRRTARRTGASPEPETLAALLRAVDAEDAVVVPEGRQRGGRARLPRPGRGTGRTRRRGRHRLRHRRHPRRSWPPGFPGGGGPWAYPCSRGGFLKADVRAAPGSARSAGRAAPGPGRPLPPRRLRPHDARAGRLRRGLRTPPRPPRGARLRRQAAVRPARALTGEGAFARGTTLAAVVTGRPFPEGPRPPRGCARLRCSPGRPPPPPGPVGVAVSAHLVVDVAAVPLLGRRPPAIGADHLPGEPPVGVVDGLAGDGIDLSEPFQTALRRRSRTVRRRSAQGGRQRVALVGEQVVQARLLRRPAMPAPARWPPPASRPARRAPGTSAAGSAAAG